MKQKVVILPVNMAGSMPKGVSRGFKNSNAFKYFKLHCQRGDIKLGKPITYYGGNYVILFLPIKRHWNSKNNIPALKRGISNILSRLKWIAKEYNTEIIVPFNSNIEEFNSLNKVFNVVATLSTLKFPELNIRPFIKA